MSSSQPVFGAGSSTRASTSKIPPEAFSGDEGDLPLPLAPVGKDLPAELLRKTSVGMTKDSSLVSDSQTAAASPSRSSASSSSSASLPPIVHPALFGDPSIDHAIAGLGAGMVATLAMHPLDLVKVRFQLADSPQAAPSASTMPASASALGASSMRSIGSAAGSTSGSVPRGASGLQEAAKKPRLGTAVYSALRDCVTRDGWKGLYRGLLPNLAGNGGSWGLYFLFYNMIKKRMQGGDPTYQTSSGQHLLAAAEASAITAMMTNPIWVVKTRVFASTRSDPTPYKGLIDGIPYIYRKEGIRGLYKGSLLALVGVSNGSIQFAAYEDIKRRRAALKRRKIEKDGGTWKREDEKLTNTEYILASGASKFVALALTYPYQVVRARIQNAQGTGMYRDIPTCVRNTYRHEGLLAFYKGLGTNALRILPGTCTTFVVYENLVWAFRSLAAKKQASAAAEISRTKDNLTVRSG